MAQGKGPRRFRCDCALTFENAQAVGEHIKETGHMKARWCMLCFQLFSKKENLEQHRRTAKKHKNDPTIPSEAPVLPKTNAPKNKPQAKPVKPVKTVAASGVPVAASSKAVVPVEASQAPKAAKAPKATGTVKGEKKVPKPVAKVVNPIVLTTILPIQKQPTVIAMPREPALVVVADPITIAYPWASGQQDPDLAMSLVARCHEESCLLSHGYYTGNQKRVRFNIKKFLPTPPRIYGVPKRKAIAVDCEMVGVANGRDELARVCAVDMITREVLIDSLVVPTEVVKDWRTKYSGVTAAKMNEARANGKALDGWPVARAKLFEFADEDTVLVGHSLNHDLKVLHISHKQVVDSGVLVAEAVFGTGRRLLRQWGLKACSQELLGIAIQSSKNGHDCMEDTLASREVVLWCIKERKKLVAWAEQALIDFEIERKERAERQKAQAKAQAEKQKKLQEQIDEQKRLREQQMAYDDENGYAYSRNDYSYGEVERMTWEEYLDACELPPGYDPSSWD